MQQRVIRLLLGFLLATSWTASFFLIFKGVSLAPPISLAAWQALVGALVASGLSVSLRGFSTFRNQVMEAWTKIGMWPIVLVAAFYLLQVVRRFTEGQSGANVLFILGLAPAIAVGVLLAGNVRDFVRTRRVPASGDLLTAVAVAVATLGVAGILANWERPSSFSPFTIFPREELMLLAGAGCWIAFLFMVKRRARDLDVAAATSVILTGAGLLLLVAALVGEGPSSLALSPQAIRLAVLLGVVGAAIGCYSWIAILRLDTTVVEVASAVLAAPVLASLLIFVDQAIGLTGANPMIGEPVFAGSVLGLLGLMLVLLARWWGAPGKANRSSGRREPFPGEPRTRVVALAMAGLAVAGVAAAVVGLALPVRTNVIQGMLHDQPPFDARWITQGYEAAGSWLALVAGAFVLLLMWRVLQGDVDLPRAGLMVGATVVALLCVPVLSDSVFVAWRSWIPTQVQHAIGTEYVQLSQERVSNPAFLVVDAAYAAALTLGIVKILWKGHKPS